MPGIPLRRLLTRARASLALRLAAPVLVAVLPLMLFAQQQASESAQATEARAIEALRTTASLLASGERLVIEGAADVVRTLSIRLEVGSSGAACDTAMRDTMRVHDGFTNLGVIDLDGTVRCSALPVPEDTDLRDRDYFQQALRTRDVAVGGYQVGRITGVPSVNVGYPILDGGGEPTGVVFGAVDLAFMESQLREVDLPAGAAVIVFDRAGVPILDTSDPRRVGDPAFQVSLSTLRVSPAVVLRGIFDDPVQVEVRDLSGGVLTVAMPSTLVTGSAAAQARPLALVATLAALFGGGAAVALGWVGVQRPIERIRNVVRQIAAGDLTQRLRPRSRAGTLDSLAADIDEMTSALAATTTELRRRAYVDPLTDLSNRHGLLLRISRYDAGTAVFVRADTVEDVGTMLGYPAADEALTATARALERVAESRDLLGRVSDHSFVLFFPSARTREAAAERMREIRRAVGEQVEIGNLSVEIAVRIGAAVQPLDATEADVLLRLAELAARGPRRSDEGTLYDPALDRQKATNLQLLGEMRRAIGRDEFQVHYQPVVCLDEPEGARFEALIRWTTGDGEHRSPGEFIPLAERTGFIEEIDRWVFDRVTRQMAEWRADGFDARVAVNVSAHSLQNADFPGYLRRVLDRTSVDPAALEVEITETALLDAFDVPLRVCQGIADLGVGLLVDDFGMGHSPLVYVHYFPISAIKVDQSFVRALPTEVRVRPLVESMVLLADRMGLGTVAEGVETEEMREAVYHLGVRHAQGFLYTPALSALDARAWVTASDGA